MKDWGDEFEVDLRLEDAEADRYDALILPGGVMNPGQAPRAPGGARVGARISFSMMRRNPSLRSATGRGSLIDAGVVEGRRMTSWPTLETDLRNAGAHWVDKDVVVDGTLVTSRKPDDLPAFNREVILLIAWARGNGVERAPRDTPDARSLC